MLWLFELFSVCFICWCYLLCCDGLLGGFLAVSLCIVCGVAYFGVLICSSVVYCLSLFMCIA